MYYKKVSDCPKFSPNAYHGEEMTTYLLGKYHSIVIDQVKKNNYKFIFLFEIL